MKTYAVTELSKERQFPLTERNAVAPLGRTAMPLLVHMVYNSLLFSHRDL